MDYPAIKSTFYGEKLTAVQHRNVWNSLGMIDWIHSEGDELLPIYSGLQVTIGTGIFNCGSVLGEMQTPSVFNLPALAFSVIYLETNLVNNTIGLGIASSGIDYPTLIQDDLINNPFGVRQIPIVKCITNSTSVTTFTDLTSNLKTQPKSDMLWTGSIIGGDPAPIDFSTYPQYDYFILYLGSQGRGVRADKNLIGAFIQGSTTGLFSEISNTGKTTYSGQLPPTGAMILKRQVHFQSGNHSTIDNTNLVGIKGVKL